MKRYLAITGMIFVLIVAAHIWRATVETHLVKDPGFILTTLVALGMSLWAIRLLLRSPQRD